MAFALLVCSEEVANLVGHTSTAENVVRVLVGTEEETHFCTPVVFATGVTVGNVQTSVQVILGVTVRVAVAMEVVVPTGLVLA